MMTRRDVVIGLLAMQGMSNAAATGEEPVLGPTLFDWQEMKPVKTATGEVRQVCKSPTATLNQLEIHITTMHPTGM
jgi:XRE family transcriptional regulator, regulator of sulfur utilization